MGFMDKVMFWKKDDFDFDNIENDSPNSNPTSNLDSNPFGQNNDPAGPVTDSFTANPSTLSSQAPNYNPEAHSPDAFAQKNSSMSSGVSSRELELISSKLDTIKALLASLDQRVGIIEQIARAEQEKDRQNQQPKNHLW